jgi:hypothetical protein
LILLGSGTSLMAKTFHQEYIKNDSIKVYVDEKLKLYQELKMKRGIFYTLTKKGVSAVLRAREKGFSQDSSKGDLTQIGGCYIFENSEVVYKFIEEYAGDLPDFEQIINFLKEMKPINEKEDSKEDINLENVNKEVEN